MDGVLKNMKNTTAIPSMRWRTKHLMTTAYELQVRPGSKLGKCQKVEAVLEEGNFDFVTNCLNTETSKAVAIKVNKNHLSSAHQARLETIILKELQCLDPDT